MNNFFLNIEPSYWVYKPGSQELTISAETASLIGIALENGVVSRANFLDRIYPDDRELFENVIDEKNCEKAIQIRIQSSFDLYIIVEFEIDQMTLPLGDPGQVEGFVKLVSTLNEIIEFYKSMLNKLGSMVWVKDKAGRFTYVNSFFSEIYGRPGSSLLGKKDEDINSAHPDEVEGFTGADQYVLQTFKRVNINLEYLTSPKTGAPMPLATIKDVIKAPFLPHATSGGSEDHQVFGHAVDVSAMDAIINHLPDFIFIKGLDHKFALVNRALANHVGVEPRELVGADENSFSNDPSYAEKARENELQVIYEQESRLNVQRTYVDRNGRRTHSLISKIPLISGDKVRAILGIVRDVTEVREREITEIYQALGHFLKSCVATMEGFVGTAIATVASDSPDALARVRGDLEQIRKVLYDSLSPAVDKALSRISLEYPEIEEFDVVSLVHVVVSEVGDPRVKVAESGDRFVVLGDRIILGKVVVYELIRNALKHNDRMENLEVLVSLEMCDKGGMLLVVSDNGRGVSASVYEKLFTRPLLTNDPKQAGLGLFEANNAVKSLFQGSVTCERIAGRGAKFVVHLPCRE